MPNVFHRGHFAVVSSVAKKPEWAYGVKRIALLELNLEKLKYQPEQVWDNQLYPRLKIDTRLKSIKRVIFEEKQIYTNTRKGYWMHRRKWEQWCEMAERFERLWPCQALAKGWPLPLE